MANLHSEQFDAGLGATRQDPQTAHARRARVMVAAAMLCAFGLVAVATALLAHLI